MIVNKKWSKRIFSFLFMIFLAGSSLYFIYDGFDSLVHFHDDISYRSDKKLSDLGYADKVETNVWLMDVQNVINLFEDKPLNIDKRTITNKGWWTEETDELITDPRFYIVVSLRNTGDHIAWGVLDYYVNGKKTRQIDVPSLPACMTKEVYIVVAATPSRDQNISGSYPDLNITWQQLYTMGENHEKIS